MRILGAYGYLVGTGHIFAEVGNAETSLALRGLALAVNDFRVNQNKPGGGIFLKCDINDCDAASNPDLGGSETDSVRCVHRFEHVIDKFLQALVENRDGLGRLFKHRIAELYDGIDHQKSLSCWQ